MIRKLFYYFIISLFAGTSVNLLSFEFMIELLPSERSKKKAESTRHFISNDISKMITTVWHKQLR